MAIKVSAPAWLSCSPGGLAVAVVLSGINVPKAVAADQLTIVSWGGAYQESQRKAYYEPYTKEKGVSDVWKLPSAFIT